MKKGCRPDASAAEEDRAEMMRAVEDVLHEIDADAAPRILVLAKVDLVGEDRRGCNLEARAAFYRRQAVRQFWDVLGPRRRLVAHYLKQRFAQVPNPPVDCIREEVIMSGVVPLVAAMVGPGAAGTAYIPGLADFVPMVKDVGSMALGGPPLVKAVTGQDITEQALGGSKVHTETSGVGDVEVDGEDACIAVIKQYLSFFPQHCEERPPIVPAADPIDRRDEALLSLIPRQRRRTYDPRKLLGCVVDRDSLFELQPFYGQSLVTSLARIDGYPVGVLANNPNHVGGAMDGPASDKLTRFADLCDTFHLPVVSFEDEPAGRATPEALVSIFLCRTSCCGYSAAIACRI